MNSDKNASMNAQAKIIKICKGHSNLEYMCVHKDSGYEDWGSYDDK